MPGLKRITDATTEPITQADAQLWLKQSSDADDDVIDALITTARTMTEDYCGRAWITQTWEYMLDAIPHNADSDDVKIAMNWPLSLSAPGVTDYIEIPRPPLILVSSVQYYNTANTAATFSSDNYHVDTWGVGSNGRICLNIGQTWPTGLRARNAILITFVAGYGAAAAVPAAVKTAIRHIVETNYDNRGGEIKMPEAAKDLLNPYRILTI